MWRKFTQNQFKNYFILPLFPLLLLMLLLLLLLLLPLPLPLLLLLLLLTLMLLLGHLPLLVLASSSRRPLSRA